MRLIGNTGRHALRTLPLATLAVALAACEGPGAGRDDTFASDLGEALAAMDASRGPCEMCAEQSDSKNDRKILSLDGQLIEFCSADCSEEFYSNPNWVQYRKKQ